MPTYKTYNRTRYVNVDFTGVQSVYANREMVFENCTNFPAHIQARWVVFKNCAPPTDAKMTVDSVTVSNCNESVELEFDAQKCNANFFNIKNCARLERIKLFGNRSCGVNVSRCPAFTGEVIRHKEDIDLQIFACRNLSVDFVARTLYIEKSRSVKNSVKIQATNVSLIDFRCGELVVIKNKSPESSYASIRGASNVRNIEIDMDAMAINHDQVRTIKIHDCAHTVDLNCKKLEKLDCGPVPHFYNEGACPAIQVPQNWVFGKNQLFYIHHPHKDQKNYVVFKDALSRWVSILKTQTEQTVIQTSYFGHKEFSTLNGFLAAMDVRRLPESMRYSDRLRRKISLFVEKPYEA